MKKKFISGLLLLSLSTGMIASAAAWDNAASVPENMRFEDVASDAYYYDAVLWAVQEDIAKGTAQTTFAPDAECTMAQVITFLWRANGSPVPQIENPFTDISQADYFYHADLWAHEKELVSGNVFTPDSPCTRGQAMLLFYLLAGSPQAELSTFEDVASDSVYSRPISWAVEQKIATGKSSSSFAPDEICTRGEMVTFIFRSEAIQ